jgi:hypothetical protein
VNFQCRGSSCHTNVGLDCLSSNRIGPPCVASSAGNLVFRDRPIRPLSHSSNRTFVFPQPGVPVLSRLVERGCGHTKGQPYRHDAGAPAWCGTPASDVFGRHRPGRNGGWSRSSRRTVRRGWRWIDARGTGTFGRWEGYLSASTDKMKEPAELTVWVSSACLELDGKDQILRIGG